MSARSPCWDRDRKICQLGSLFFCGGRGLEVVDLLFVESCKGLGVAGCLFRAV